MERIKFSGKRCFNRPWSAKGQSAGDTQSNDRREQQNLFRIDDDVGLHVLGCRVDILRTNCKKLLKVKMSWGRGGGGVQDWIDDCLYSAVLRSLEQTHCARM